jgi:GLPGLI family protein
MFYLRCSSSFIFTPSVSLGYFNLNFNKMKNIILSFFLLISINVFSQAKLTSYGSVTYEYIMPAERIIIKESTLYFNDSISKFVYDKFDSKRINQSKIKSEGNSISLNFNSEDEQGSNVYRNYKKEKIIVREAKTDKLFESYLYEDNWLKIDWEIQEDTITIGNFKCKKAKGNFRGRTYIAWFTEEIPLPYGPWKLFGLPGLILQAEDTEKMFKVSFMSINYPIKSENTDLTEPTAVENKTLKEYVSFLDNYNDLVFKKMQSRLPRHLANSMQQGTKANSGRKYRDEKVFEWEK